MNYILYSLLLVADDSMSFLSSESELRQICKIYEYFSKHYDVKFSYEKTIVHIFGDKKLLKRLREDEDLITFDGNPLLYPTESAHLGTVVHENPYETNKANIENRIKQTNKKLHNLLGSSINANKILHHKLQKTAYCTYLKSSLISTLEQFPLNPGEMSRISCYERSVIRNFFQLRKNATVDPLYLFLGQEPIECSLHRAVFSLFYNVWTCGKMKLTETAEICKKFLNINLKMETWPQYIRRLCKLYKIQDPVELLEIDPPNSEVWRNYIKDRLQSYHEDKLKTKCNLMKISPYLNINERYFSLGLDLRLKIPISKNDIRGVNLCIQHIIGEYPCGENINRRNREISKYCKLCLQRNIEVVESSYHILSECHTIWEDDTVLKQAEITNLVASDALQKENEELKEIFTLNKDIYVQFILDPLSPNLEKEMKLSLFSEKEAGPDKPVRNGTDLASQSPIPTEPHPTNNQRVRKFLIESTKLIKFIDDRRKINLNIYFKEKKRRDALAVRSSKGSSGQQNLRQAAKGTRRITSYFNSNPAPNFFPS